MLTSILTNADFLTWILIAWGRAASQLDMRFENHRLLILTRTDPSNPVPSSYCHQMETFSVLLALCAGNSSVTGKFPSHRPGTRSFDTYSDLRLNKRLSKQSLGWWFETPLRSLWRHCNIQKLSILDFGYKNGFEKNVPSPPECPPPWNINYCLSIRFNPYFKMSIYCVWYALKNLSLAYVLYLIRA